MSGFQALLDDKTLRKYQISLEISRKKNINKNPVAEHAVQEVEYELLQQDPTGGSVSPVTLSIALSCLNSRLRSRGLSAREMWSQRNQYTNGQTSVSDTHLSESLHLCRLENHKLSELSKAPCGLPRPRYNIKPGDLVYLYVDHNKLRGRDCYMVVSVDNDWCNLRKFVGSQFRAPLCHVKMQECYKVLSDFSAITSLHTRCQPHSEYSSNDDETGESESPPVQYPTPPPSIPPEIFVPSTGSSESNVHIPIPTSCDYESIQDTPSTCDVQESSTIEPVSTVADIEPVAPRRSTRKCTAPARYQDYDMSG